MEYAPAPRKKQLPALRTHNAQKPAGYNRAMLLPVAWIVFLIECALSVLAGSVFFRFWSQATISRSVRMRAVLFYALGCALILALTLALPL
jgi:hypothetical protein